NDVFAYLGRASVYKELGEEEKYLKDIDAVLTIDPKNLSALNEKTSYLISKSKYDEALTLIKNIQKLDKNNIQAYFNQGLAQKGKGLYADAIKSFDMVLDLDFTIYDAYYQRGVCHSKLGNVDEACMNFELAKNMGHEKAADMYHLNCEFGAW
ncbi:MAG: tetratricopeptide repeat protein, partial [Flavobacteriales bacterium]|nr:tetratricopeptide repeat protein [Flavobacteriales bacterium]